MARAIDAKALEKKISEWVGQPGNGDYYSGYDDALCAVQDLIADMPTLTPPNEWVSVEERLPEVTKNCKEGYDHNGIDRIDSSVGYEPNNVVSCCKICNYAKSNLTKDDFINWAIRVAEHSKAMADQWGRLL